MCVYTLNLTDPGRSKVRVCRRGESDNIQRISEPRDLIRCYLFIVSFTSSLPFTRTVNVSLASGAAQEVGLNLVCWDELIN